MEKLKQKENQRPAYLQQTQQLDYMDITGALLACPTTAMKILLDLTTHLYLQLKNETVIVIKLDRNRVLKRRDSVRQLKILQEFVNLSKLK